MPVNHLRILVRVRWVTDRWSGLASDAYLCSPRSRSTSDTTNNSEVLLFFRFFGCNKLIKTTDPESLLGSGVLFECSKMASSSSSDDARSTKHHNIGGFDSSDLRWRRPI